MNINKLIASLSTTAVAAGAFAGSAIISPALADECNAEVDLQGSVSKNEATVTNYSSNDDCTYDATLAVYESPKEPETTGWIEAQKLIGSKTVSVKAGETVTITVDGSGESCWYQSDLIRGKDVLTPPVYRTAMDVDVYELSDSCKEEEEEETTTETKTESKPVKLAETGNSVLIYSFVLAGAITLLAGMVLRKNSK